MALVLLPRLAGAEERFAIVIGANAGWANDRPLRYAEVDAERVRNVLIELGDFSPDRVALLRDPETSDVRAQLRKLGETLRATRDQSVVFVYYSGHADGTHLHLRGDPLSYSELETRLRDLPASVRVGVVDACKSGSIASKGGQRVASFRLRSHDEARVQGLVLLASSGADELSQESRALAGSVFTHHLVSGLRGAADRDGDEQVSLSELYQYSYERTAADTSSSAQQQTPTFRFDLRGQGDLVLARLARRLSTLSLPRESGRRYVVVDQQEWKLIAESRSQQERSVSLALPPGRYRLKRIGKHGIDVADLQMVAKGTVHAGGLAFQEMPLSVGVVKGIPDDKSSEAYREWLRGQALARLADGKASSALVLFDKVLEDWPGDWGSLRGRARALIRLAEAYEKIGEDRREQESLQAALDSDPGLAEDPDFKAWYQRTENRRKASTEREILRERISAREFASPRRSKRWGFEIDVISAKAVSSLVTSAIWNKHWMPYLSFDLRGTGFGAGLRAVLLSSNWSPFVSAGGHVSFRELGFAEGGVGAEDMDFQSRFGRSLHGEFGLHYLDGSGFAMAAGMGFVVSPSEDAAEQAVIAPYPTFALGWFFQ